MCLHWKYFERKYIFAVLSLAGAKDKCSLSTAKWTELVRVECEVCVLAAFELSSALRFDFRADAERKLGAVSMAANSIKVTVVIFQFKVEKLLLKAQQKAGEEKCQVCVLTCTPTIEINGELLLRKTNLQSH